MHEPVIQEAGPGHVSVSSRGRKLQQGYLHIGEDDAAITTEIGRRVDDKRDGPQIRQMLDFTVWETLLQYFMRWARTRARDLIAIEAAPGGLSETSTSGSQALVRLLSGCAAVPVKAGASRNRCCHVRSGAKDPLLPPNGCDESPITPSLGGGAGAG